MKMDLTLMLLSAFSCYVCLRSLCSELIFDDQKAKPCKKMNDITCISSLTDSNISLFVRERTFQNVNKEKIM